MDRLPEKTKLAQIRLYHQHFRIEGPPELVSMTQAIIEMMKDQDPDEIKYAVHDMWSRWHVICSVSGENVRLSELRYWDVEKNLIYLRPDLIPQNTKRSELEGSRST